MNREILNSNLTVICQDLTKEQKRDLIVNIVKNWNKEESKDEKIA